MTKTDMRFVRSDLGTPALTREVAALRCGLDAPAWNDADSSDKCVEMVKKDRGRCRHQRPIRKGVAV